MKVSAGSARRYARAALDVATAKGDTGFQEELEGLARAFAENAELRTVLVHPAIPAEKKTAVVGGLLGGARADGILRRLVSLLLQRDRIELLPLIAQQYARLANMARGVVDAEAVSARELDESEARAISAA